MPDELTQRQREVLDVIKNYFEAHKIPPTVRDLAGKLEITVSTAHKLLQVLKKKGWVDLKGHLSRGIILINNSPKPRTVSIPILGAIPAGSPVLSPETYEGEIEVDLSLVTGGELFALKVKGESMTGANIFDGDTAIIRKQEDAANGDIIAAMLDDEVTLKRLRKNGRKVFLMPENEKFSPIEIHPENSASVIGKLVAIIRKF
jgi:repressor LexA